MQIRKSAVGESAEVIQRQRSPLVSAQQQLRIRGSILFSKTRSIDEIAAITRQRDAVAHLLGSRPRFGVLSGNPADAYDGLLRRVDQDEAHLQQNLELRRNRRRIALVEAFRAVAALKHEHLAARRTSEPGLQRIDLPRRDQRRQARDRVNDLLKVRTIGVYRLLLGRFVLPGIRKPVRHRSRMMEVPGLFKGSSAIGLSTLFYFGKA